MLRGIPLQAGHHTLRLQYVAPAWKISEAITTISLLAFFAYLIWSLSPAGNRFPPASIGLSGNTSAD